MQDFIVKMTQHLAPLDWMIIIAFLVFAFGLALYHMRRATSGMDNYFASGRKAAWWLLGTSMVATTFAADTPLAVSAFCANVKGGSISLNWYWWSAALSTMLGVFFFSRLWRRSGVLTDTELVELRWSTGLRKDQRTLKTTHIDGRPRFMWYEFEARTQDNVELVLGITFFWQIVDVEAMVRTTDDAPGDVCSHARSAITQSASQLTLEQFLSACNDIVREAVLETGDAFHAERGVRLHAVEVRSISCTSQTSR